MLLCIKLSAKCINVNMCASCFLAPTIEFEQASYQVREPPGPDGIEVLNIKVIRKGDLDRTSKIRCSTRDGSAQSGVDYNPKSRVLKFSPGKHIKYIYICKAIP